MSDSYQAVYDAVRSRIHGCDSSDAIDRALRDAFGNVGSLIQQSVQIVEYEAVEAVHLAARPSAVYRPAIGRDGDKWCALYGENLMEGVAGFGNSPAEAMADFDLNWTKKIEATRAQP